MENKYCIDMLLGGELCEIGRVTDLVWWEFEKDGILYSLHTQCSFRVTHEGVSVLTRRSIYNIIDVRTPLSKITSTGEIEQRFRLN